MVFSYFITNTKLKAFSPNNHYYKKKHLNRINQIWNSNITYLIRKNELNNEKFILFNHIEHTIKKKKETDKAYSTIQRRKTKKIEKNIFVNLFRCLIILILICPLLSNYKIEIKTADISNFNQFYPIINVKNIIHPDEIYLDGVLLVNENVDYKYDNDYLKIYIPNTINIFIISIIINFFNKLELNIMNCLLYSKRKNNNYLVILIK